MLGFGFAFSDGVEDTGIAQQWPSRCGVQNTASTLDVVDRIRYPEWWIRVHGSKRL